jgi:tetratricopeptide (TPR) repeat protein
MVLIWKLAGFLYWRGQRDLWHMLQGAQGSGGQPPPPDCLFDYALQMLGGGGHLLCLDDAQWVEDDPLLAQFVERLEDLIRAGEVALILVSRRVPDILRRNGFEPLGGLNLADTVWLIRTYGLALSEALVSKLHAHAGGNPGLLSLAANVVKDATDPGGYLEADDDTLRLFIKAHKGAAKAERVLSRLAGADDIERYLIKEVDQGLSEDGRAVLTAVAALLGYPGSRDAIEAVSGGSRLKHVLLKLTDRHLLTVEVSEGEEHYALPAMLRAFYYDLPNRRERQGMHCLAAEYYVSQEPDHLKAALHYNQAGEYEKAAGLASTDAWALINQGQAGPLCRLLERLRARPLEPETEVAVHFACGQVQAFLGEGQQARESYQEAFAHLAALPDSHGVRRYKAQACLGVGESLRYESPPQALAWLERGLAELAGVADQAAYWQEEAALCIRAGDVQRYMGNYAAALPLLEQGLGLLAEGPSQWEAIALSGIGSIHLYQGHNKQAGEYYLSALEISQQLHDHQQMLVILSNLGISREIDGDWAGAADDYRRALDLARQLGSIGEQARIENSLGLLYTKQGEDEAALRHLSRAMHLDRIHNLRLNLIYVLNSLALLQMHKRDWEAAEASVSEAEQLALELGTKHTLPETYYLRAQIRLAEGRLQAAREDVQRTLELTDELGMNLEEGIGQRVLGQALQACGQVEPALAAFQDSLATLAGLDPYEAARTQAAWGRCLASGPDVERGAALLGEARTTFGRLGARRDLAELEEILEACGVEGDRRSL